MQADPHEHPFCLTGLLVSNLTCGTALMPMLGREHLGARLDSEVDCSGFGV